MKMRRSLAVLCVLMLIAGVFAGCGGAGSSKRIVRIGHNQSTAHPSHIALEAFADYINNSELGEKYDFVVSCSSHGVMVFLSITYFSES